MKKVKGLSPLFIISAFIVFLMIIPAFTIIKELIQPVGSYWDHIVEFLLIDYVKNTVILVISVMLLSSIIGTFLSWFMTQYDLKYKPLLWLLLILPLAIPTYIGGYVYGGIFNYGGTLERILRFLDLEPMRLDILSLPGAILIFTLFLTPYVVLVTRSFFNKLSSSYYESSKLLGKSNIYTFFRVILPLSRNAIFGGAILIGLEILNDYGLVSYFGIPTFSTAIFKTWFGLGDISSAIRLAGILMLFVLIMLSFEHFTRSRGKVTSKSTRTMIQKLDPLWKGIFYGVYWLYVTLALILPLVQLIYWAKISKSANLSDLLIVFKDTLFLATIVTLIVIISSLMIGQMNRIRKSFLSKFFSRSVVLGYSIPASIIAVAVLIFFNHLKVLQLSFATMSLFMLCYALVIRYMAIGFSSIESGYDKIGLKYYHASKLLGKSDLKTYLFVDLPMLKTAIMSGIILTYVDVLKELPLTLILRPFNFDTLSTKVFTYAGDEMIHEASVFSLMIISVSVLSILLLQYIQRSRHD